MNIVALILPLGLFLASGTAFSAMEGLTEISVRTEIESMLQRSLGKDSFIVQVSGVYRTESDKRLLTSEVIQKTDASEKRTPPPDLPGFDVVPQLAQEKTPAEYRKEQYEHSEKDKLTKLNVQIFYDESLDAAVISRIKETVLAYLSNQIDVKYGLSFAPFIPKRLEVISRDAPWERYALIAVAALFLLLLVLWIIWRLFFRKDEKKNGASPHAQGEISQAALKSDEKPRSPADIKRSFLLELFLSNPDPFRVYLASLRPEQKSALAKQFEGPVFEGMLKALGLESIQKGEGGEADESYDLRFFSEDFSEFLKAFQWQRSLFFGFLPQCSLESLIAFFREADPLVAAVLARFLSADQVSKILAALPVDIRREVIKNLSRAETLSLNEISKIEADVKEQLLATPSVGTQLTKSELDLLSDIVVNSDDQDKILRDIQVVSPKSFEQLSKLRFNLEDIPTLPQDVVARVLGELDNTQLALALHELPNELADYLLNLIPANRRALIISQRSTLAGIGEQEVKKARAEMASLFRKELS